MDTVGPISVHGTPVHGIGLDAQTRCVHYNSALDIIAIKMHCCGLYYACRECHDVLADHPAEVIPKAEQDSPGVLCGACGRQLTVTEYFSCENICPACRAGFNPGCRNHYHLYFSNLNLKSA
jgi:uncharacterized CHY-type Zn-finger protein